VITCGGASLTKTIEVLPATLTAPYYTETAFPEELMPYLVDGEIYTLSCYSIVTDTGLGYVYPGEKNFTISVINGEQEYISDKATALNTVTRISTTFVYNEHAPIKLRVYGQWLEINPQNTNHEVGGFALYHEEQLIANPNLLTGMGERDNVRTGTDYLQDTTGISAYNNASIESSTERSSEGERSLKISMPGVTNQEAATLFRSLDYGIPTVAGEERTIIFKYNSLAPFRSYINCMTSSGTTSEDILAIPPASPSNFNIGFITGKISNENTAFQAMRIYNTNPPAANTIYIDDIRVYALNPLDNIEHKTDYEPPAALFNNPENLMSDGDYAQVTLSPGKSSAEYRFPNLNWAGFEEDKEIIIKGIEVRGDLIISDEISVNATLQQADAKADQSSIVLADSAEFDVGDSGDKWGLNQIQLSDLTFLLSLTNTGPSISTVQVRNIRIIISYIYDQTLGNQGIYLDDVHSREYGIFIARGWKIPEGVDNELQSFKLTRSPGERITASTPTSKSFEVPFIIMADDLEDATEKLQDITEWMTNELDSDDVPITKRLRFEWDPKGREFNAVLDGALDPDFSEVGKYLVKAKFFIQEGIGWGPLRASGATGRNTGRVFIRPVIQISCTGDPQVILWDNISDQFLTIDHQFTPGTVLLVDMKNMTITDTGGVDYSDEITHNSYWFKIRGGAWYNLTGSTGCIIQRVEFREAL
jgi:phage-related protein